MKGDTLGVYFDDAAIGDWPASEIPGEVGEDSFAMGVFLLNAQVPFFASQLAEEFS